VHTDLNQIILSHLLENNWECTINSFKKDCGMDEKKMNCIRLKTYMKKLDFRSAVMFAE
jgi:hypothetical protein